MWSNQFQQTSKKFNQDRETTPKNFAKENCPSNSTQPVCKKVPRHHKFKATTFQDRHTCIRHQVQDINTSASRFFCFDFYFASCFLLRIWSKRVWEKCPLENNWYWSICLCVEGEDPQTHTEKSDISSKLIGRPEEQTVSIIFIRSGNLNDLNHWIIGSACDWRDQLGSVWVSDVCFHHNGLVSIFASDVSSMIILIWEEFPINMNHQLMM